MKRIYLLVLTVFFAFSIEAQKQSKKVMDRTVGKVELDRSTLFDAAKNLDFNKKTQSALTADQKQIKVMDRLEFESKYVNLKASFVHDNTPNLIEGRIAHAKGANLDKKVEEYLEAAAVKMQLENANAQFVEELVWTDDINQTHIKMQQQYNGVDIFGAEIILHADNIGIFSLNGHYHSDHQLENISTKADLSKEEAKEIIKKTFKNYKPNVAKGHIMNLFPELDQWQIENVIMPIDGTYKLAYHSKVYENLGAYWTYFVDANTGEILRKYSNICQFHANGNHANCKHDHGAPLDGPAVANATDLLGQTRAINTYDVGGTFFMIDGSRDMFSLSQSNLPDEPVGAIWTIDLQNTPAQDPSFSHFTSSNNSWGSSPEAVSAHHNGALSYEYFKNVHGRNSISGQGGNIISMVNVADENGNSMGNAFWNGVAIWYGNGDAAFQPLGRGLDVAGHELSHGVVQNTANLEYYSESGAMNESFADIFGAMIDRDDWLIGEDVVKTSVFSSGALRSMEDPHNGQSTGDYGSGWQPRTVGEKFNGSQDNAGVHINSGIPNYAYYLFATANGMTKEIAEKVFYRALTTYLTKSSVFTDLRIAVVKSAEDLYGGNVVAAANQAFDAVQIPGGSGGGTYQYDNILNPGTDLMLFSDLSNSNIYVVEVLTGNIIFNPLSGIDNLSQPSVTDDGSQVVWVGKDKLLYMAVIDWSTETSDVSVLSNQPVWRNCVISKNGERIAGIVENSAGEVDNFIYIYNFGPETDDLVQLYNPTTANGIGTGEILYADAMEFDISGQFLMYDGVNTIEGATGTIDYWDIGFVEIWDNDADDWAQKDDSDRYFIQKLFANLDEGVSIGNPTFAKNSNYVIAFDWVNFDDDVHRVLGVNTETGETGVLAAPNDFSWPSFSREDNYLVYENGVDIELVEVNSDKINQINGTDGTIVLDAQFGVWFSNGDRPLTNVEEVIANDPGFEIFPNPVSNELNIQLELEEASDVFISIHKIDGKLVSVKPEKGTAGDNVWVVPTNHLESGQYIIKTKLKDRIYTKSFIKI